jgi:hypothetical protein
MESVVQKTRRKLEITYPENANANFLNREVDTNPLVFPGNRGWKCDIGTGV